MHSFGYRANALLTFSITILALICAIASFSDNFNSPTPSAQVKVLNVNWFRKKSDGDEVTSFDLNLFGSQPYFEYISKLGDIVYVEHKTGLFEKYYEPFDFSCLGIPNQVFVFLAAEYETPKNALNQVSLWDGIIPTKEQAKFWIHTTNKYRFIDQGSNLRAKDYNLTLHWHVMPKTGKMFADSLVMSGFHLPEEYK